jgi:hypothetical protein
MQMLPGGQKQRPETSIGSSKLGQKAVASQCCCWGLTGGRWHVWPWSMLSGLLNLFSPVATQDGCAFLMVRGAGAQGLNDWVRSQRHASRRGEGGDSYQDDSRVEATSP